MQLLKEKLALRLRAGANKGNVSGYAVSGPTLDDYSFQYLKEVTQLEQGASFGELALSTDKPRAATIISLETPTELAVLEKDAYDKIMGRTMQKRIEE